MIRDHPLRMSLSNELHARPFPVVSAPAEMAFLAIKDPEDTAGRDRAGDLAHLIALLDHHGAPHPPPGAQHWSGQIGTHFLKWESHTEFVAYTAVSPAGGGRPFDPSAFDVFPPAWLDAAPGVRIASALIRIERGDTVTGLDTLFAGESLACSAVLDGAALIASDFRVDPAGHVRFAIAAAEGTGEHRIGRIAQRLCEIETYRAMSMLGLAEARRMAERMEVLDRDLADLTAEMKAGGDPAATLQSLLDTSAEVEALMQGAAFRFGATAAYEALVLGRITVLREERWRGRQTFGEFMARRFDPSMRTVKSTERRLSGMAQAASRAGELLRTRVDVERSAQNQRLLESMDQRADAQLRLQETVEGLSVVAISYYAVSLATYLLMPLAEAMHWSKTLLASGLVVPVVLGVWLMVGRIRRRLH